MRLTLAVLCVVLLPVRGVAQTVCTPTPLEFLKWSPPGAGTAPVAKYWTVAAQGYLGDPDGFVPQGEVWLIKAAGGATDDGRQLEWMLQIEHHKSDGTCCWLIPLHRQNGTAAGTPILALERPIVLEAGERLQMRVNGIASNKVMAILWVGWSFPDVCLPRLLGMETAASGAGGVVVSPTFAALSAAASAASAALLAVAQSAIGN